MDWVLALEDVGLNDRLGGRTMLQNWDGVDALGGFAMYDVGVMVPVHACVCENTAVMLPSSACEMVMR